MADNIKTVPVTFANKGIILKSSTDEIPIESYASLVNVITDRENTVSVRKGFTRLNDGLSAVPYSSYILKDYNGNIWRYAIAGRQLFMAQVTPTPTAFLPVSGGANLSDGLDPRAFFANYTLSGQESKPYVFIADGKVFVKHPGGSEALRRVGIPKPTKSITGVEIVPTVDTVFEGCEDYTAWSAGDPAAYVPTFTPSIWWGTASCALAQRYYYAKYSFNVIGGETCPSNITDPQIWVPPGKSARVFWKKPTTTIAYTTEYGGSGGSAFQDTLSNIPAGARLHQLKIRAYDTIDAIQPIYILPDGSLVDGAKRGGSGGGMNTITFDEDEYITKITGYYGPDVNSIIVHTNKRTCSMIGRASGTLYEITVPASTLSQGNLAIGFKGRSGAYLNKLGIAYFARSYDGTVTPPVAALSWNLYVGTDPDDLRKVNTDPIPLTDIFDEPVAGFSYSGYNMPKCNMGVNTSDTGETGNSIKIAVTGDGVLGKAGKYLENEYGNPIIVDMGTLDSSEGIDVSIRFANAEAKANCRAIRVTLVLSDSPGDLGTLYQYFAIGEALDFDAYTPGIWGKLSFSKSSFTYMNLSGTEFTEIGWNTVSAVFLEIETMNPSTGGKTCGVSFDNLTYTPSGKIIGSDIQWTFTYYDSKTNTESDFADVFSNPLGALAGEQIRLLFPTCPPTTPPLANPDFIRIYRMGGTITQFQRVDSIAYAPGVIPGPYVDDIPDSLLGDPLELDNQLPPDFIKGMEVADNRIWTWGGTITISDGTVVPEPPNRLRFSKRVQVEQFPAENYIYVGSGSEQIQRVMEHDGELFIFTLTKVYRIVGSSLADYAPVSTAVNQGLLNPHGLARGTRGLFMQSYDGIYEYPSGRKVSEPINEIFFRERVNNMPPMAEGRATLAAMAFWNSKLYFSFPMTSDPNVKNDGIYVWDVLYERWHFYYYGAQGLFTEPITNILVGSNLTLWDELSGDLPVSFQYSGNWPMQLDSGFIDQCSSGNRGIYWSIDTKAYDLGAPDQEKRFIDFVLDADTQGYGIGVQMVFDEEEPDPMGAVMTSGREQKILPILVGEGESRLATRLQIRIVAITQATATAAMRLYKLMHRYILEPMRHRTYVTDWSDCGSPQPKFFRELWIELDTYGVPLEKIELHIDQAVGTIINANTNCNGRRKFFYGLPPDLRGTLARLKICTQGEHEVKVYDYEIKILEEPPQINSFQMPWSEEEWPYPKLWKEVVFDIDTNNQPIGFNFWMDGVISQSFDLQCPTRQLITHSLDKDSFGKLGRITVAENYLDPFCCLPQGVRIYSVRFVTDKDPADVTFSDTYEQLMNYDRTKIIRRFWIAMKNPDSDVTMQIYADDVLASTKIIVADRRATGHSKRRIDLESNIKGRLFRVIFSSAFAFQLYWEKSEIEMKGTNPEDGYGRIKLAPPQTL